MFIETFSMFILKWNGLDRFVSILFVKRSLLWIFEDRIFLMIVHSTRRNVYVFLSFLNITTAPVYDPFISSLPSVHSQKVSISFYPCVYSQKVNISSHPCVYCTLKKYIFRPTLVCTIKKSIFHPTLVRTIKKFENSSY